MYLELIEDYQSVIRNSQTNPEVIIALSGFVRDILTVYKNEIDQEVRQRMQSAATDTYVSRLREHERALEVELEALRETPWIVDDVEQGHSERTEKSALLESLRSQIDQVLRPQSESDLEIICSSVEALRGEIDVLNSVIGKLDQKIDYNFNGIEDLSIRVTMLSERLKDIETFGGYKSKTV